MESFIEFKVKIVDAIINELVAESSIYSFPNSKVEAEVDLLVKAFTHPDSTHIMLETENGVEYIPRAILSTCKMIITWL